MPSHQKMIGIVLVGSFCAGILAYRLFQIFSFIFWHYQCNTRDQFNQILGLNVIYLDVNTGVGDQWCYQINYVIHLLLQRVNNFRESFAIAFEHKIIFEMIQIIFTIALKRSCCFQRMPPCFSLYALSKKKILNIYDYISLVFTVYL